MQVPYVHSEQSTRCFQSEIRELLAWSRRPNVVSFGGGLPDASLFPTGELAAVMEEVLSRSGHQALSYGPTVGEPCMLRSLARHMADFDDPVDENHLLVTASAQQGLDLLAMLFIDPGSDVLIERPSYVGAIQAFTRCGAHLHGIDLTPEGIDTDALEARIEVLRSLGRTPRLIYVIPDFQNPSGVDLSLPKRQAVVEIGRRHGIPVVEDSPYRELAFSGHTAPSLRSLAGDAVGVITLKTLSKILLPGFRLGWLAAAPEVIARASLLKQSVDLCTSPFLQFVTSDFIDRGLLQETCERARRLYAIKRRVMTDALQRHMPVGTTWSTPQGGMFLWVTLPAQLDATVLLRRCAPRGAVFVTGGAFFADDGGRDCLRLNYSLPTEAQIERGIAIIGEAASELLAGHRGTSCG